MNVLLVSPFGRNLVGGIAQWTNYITAYYDSMPSSDVNLSLLYYDKSKQGFPTDSFVVRLFKGCKNYLTLLRLYKKALNKNNFDIVHVCTSGSYAVIKDILFAKIAHRKVKKFVLHTHYGRIPELMCTNSIEARLFRYLVPLCSSFVVMDRNTEAALQAVGCKVSYLPNPISQEIINIGRANLHKDDKTIVYIGHIIPTKGITELVTACSAVPFVELFLYGPSSDAHYSSSIQKIAGKNIHFMGSRSHAEILEILSKATVMVLPSYSEGFPNVILEAMACKCPIIATSVGAIPEMLDTTEDPCGICIPPKNVEEIKQAIVCYIDSPEYRNECAEKAYKRVTELFSLPVIWEQLVSVWRNA